MVDQRRKSVRRWVYYCVGLLALVIFLIFVAMQFSQAKRENVSSLTPISTATATPYSSIPEPSPTPLDPLSRTLLATVQLIIPIDGEGRSSTGSGSVLTEGGYILTNYHVIGDLQTGKLYNRKGTIYVALSPSDLKGPPKTEFIATIIEDDIPQDLALIKITALADGSTLPLDLGLVTMPIGDSESVNIGDELSIIGFPGLGGDTVTFTKGSVSGFLIEEGWIKTDAEINQGNSGGAAVNETWELVGIPSQAATETVELPGKIGLVRPVNLAHPLIDRALREAP